MRTRSNPKSEAEALLQRIDRRKRNLIGLLCIPFGVVLAEVGVGALAVLDIGFATPGYMGMAMWVAGFVGLIFGALSVLWVPLALHRKPWKRACLMLASITVGVTVVVTIPTGFFPLFIAGLTLSTTSLGIMLWMRNEPIAWSADRCVACRYDLTGVTVTQCPECGITAADVNAVGAQRLDERSTSLARIWLGVITALWAVASVLALRVVFDSY